MLVKPLSRRFNEDYKMPNGFDNYHSIQRFHLMEPPYICENNYTGSNWNKEKTYKYIFIKDGKRYEVGYYEHYQDDHYVKSVIELPVSYGCLSHCRFCASSRIKEFIPLTEIELCELFTRIYNMHCLFNYKYVLLSISGIGDIWFNFNNVIHFIQRISSCVDNTHLTVSSCYWTEETLHGIETLNTIIPIRFVQITYISDKYIVINKTIPNF